MSFQIGWLVALERLVLALQALQDLLMRSAALASEQEGRDKRQAAAEFGLFPPSADCRSPSSQGHGDWV